MGRTDIPFGVPFSSTRKTDSPSDVLATFSLGGSVPDRASVNERSIHAADVLASL